MYYKNTVKLGFKELLDKEQIGNSEPFPVTNLPIYLINSEKICDDPKLPYYAKQSAAVNLDIKGFVMPWSNVPFTEKLAKLSLRDGK